MHPVLQKWKFYTELSTLNWNKEKASVVTTLMLQLRRLIQNTEESTVIDILSQDTKENFMFYIFKNIVETFTTRWLKIQ